MVTGTRGDERVTARPGRPRAGSTASGSALSTATCCWSAAAGTRRCTCSARPAARCATTTPSARSCPASSSTASASPAAANGVFDLAGCLRERTRGRRARRWPSSGSTAGIGPIAGGDQDAGESSRRRLVLWRVPDPAGRGHASSSTSSATRRWPTSPAPSAPGMRSVEHIKRYTTIGTAHDQGKTSGVVASGHHRRAARRPDRESRHHHVPAALHAGGVRRAGRPQPRAPVRPRAGHRRARLARRPAARCSRTSASGSARATTRCPGRTWRPRCCANAPPCAAGSASSTAPRWARSTCRAPTPASSSTCSTRT